MRKKLIIGAFLFLALILIGTPSFVSAAAMTDYCQTPPFINTIVPPNIMLLVDVSLSMGFYAYQSTSYGSCSHNSSISCSVNSDCGIGNTCTPRKTYEGYFVPNKNYALNADGIYYEYVPSGTPCVIKYTYPCSDSSSSGCTTTRPADALNTCSGRNRYYCTPKGNPTSSTGDCGSDTTGNWLNYTNMERIDLLRWAMTGGSPSTCTSSDWTRCDPRVYKDAGMTASGKVGTVCKDDLQLNSAGTVTGHGCILMADNSTKVSVPWSRISDGLAYQFEDLPVQPRIGAMFYGGTTVSSNYVYVGDFTAANSRSNYTYQNLLTEVNATNLSGYTPTGPAFWDVFHYLSQTDPEYGGIPPMSGGGDYWKNPMYDCPDKGGSNCVFIPCTKSFVMVMSDGLWNQGGGPPASNTCNINTGFENHSADPVVPSYKMHMGFKNVKAGTSGVDTKVSAVYALGLFISTEGEKALQNIALYGSFDNTAKNWPSNRTDYPGIQVGDPSNCAITTPGALCPGNQGTGSNCNAIPTSSADWDKNADGVADTYFYADDALAIRSNIMNAVLDMLARASSGTAASVLASSEGRGANILQALFHPRKPFDNGTSADWVGQMQNLWYYIDPKLKANTIREDTVQDKVENLTQDRRVIFRFDTSQNKTVVDLFSDPNADGIADNPVLPPLQNVDEVKSIWEAGFKLFSRNLSTSPRTIKTTLTGSSPYSFADFTTANAAALAPYLQATTTTEAMDIINYVHGYDYVCTGTTTACSTDADCGGAIGSCLNYRNRTVTKGGTTSVWKLGDIVTSTPKLQSTAALNNYYTIYKDATYASFTQSTNYKNYGTAYVGANDGMLHAFNFGVFEESWPGQNKRFEPARLTITDPADFGKERWSYMPRNLLPYLKYLSDPEYCHLFYVDASPLIFDASINPPTPPTGCTGDYWQCDKKTTYQVTSTDLDLANTSWRTVLVGSMRFGGACRGKNAAACTDCVRTPGVDLNGDGDTLDAGEDSVGYSSYFALDITEQDNPKLLWEFSSPDLGFSSPSPAFIRIAGRKPNPNDGGLTTVPDQTRNGRWFVVLASGPTGPVSDLKFQAHSDQNLKLFILDLKTGELLRTIDSGINNAFAGSLLGGKVDYESSPLDYQDDALYFGYTKKCTDSTLASNHVCTLNTWTDGGIMRLVTKDDLSGNSTLANGNTALNPANWALSTVISGIGPVTASVASLVKLSATATVSQGWLYFGTGRYFFQGDDLTNQRTLFGIQEPCIKSSGFESSCADSWNFCSTPVSGAGPATCGNLYNATTGVYLMFDSIESIGAKGWYISLESPTNTNVPAGGITTTNITATAERVITDPLAVPNGCVFFTTFAPTEDICSFGGNTFLWAVRLYNGGTCRLQGTALLQLSTGEIKEINLATAFEDKIAKKLDAGGDLESHGRRTPPGFMSGVPPVGQGLSVVISPTPVDRVIQIQKK